MAFQTKKGTERVERAVRKASAKYRAKAEEVVGPILEADERIVAMASAMTGFHPSAKGPAGAALQAASVKGWMVVATDRRVFFLPFKRGGMRARLTGEVEGEFPREEVRVLEWEVSDPSVSVVLNEGTVKFVLDVAGEPRTYHLWDAPVSDAEELIEALGGTTSR